MTNEPPFWPSVYQAGILPEIKISECLTALWAILIQNTGRVFFFKKKKNSNSRQRNSYAHKLSESEV